jgi:hypothetical protein
LLCATAAFAVIAGSIAPAAADDNDRGNDRRNNDRVIYSSIPKKLPGNVASVGPEAYAYREVGDGLVFIPGAGGVLDEISVIMSSWGCVTGHWYSNDCATPRGAKFNQSITLKVYSVIDVGGPPVPTPGTVLATLTKTFNIPYRPSADPARCPATPSKWFSERDDTCYNGIASPITFDLSSLRVPVPARIIVGVSYNSSHYGYAPIGESPACYTSSAGCPYDSLNVATDGNPRIGSVVDPDGIFINYAFASSYCQPHPANVFQLDSGPGCWTGFHPQIEVVSKGRSKYRSNRREDPSD